MRRIVTRNGRMAGIILPVMFGFVVMGVVDVAGLVRSYVQADFGLSDAVAGFIPSSCFLWFLLLSIPSGLAMDRVGRKEMVAFSMLVDAIGLAIPFFFRGGAVPVFIGLGLLGMGNTMLFVSLNPLAHQVVGEDKVAGTLSIGTSLKSATAVMIPVLLGLAAGRRMGWQAALLAFALVSFAGGALMAFSPSVGAATAGESSLGSVLKLLTDKKMLFCFLASMALVGLDVLMISYLPGLIQSRGGITLDRATISSGIYPLAKTAASLVGGIILLRVSERHFLPFSLAVMLLGLVLTLAAHSGWAVLLGAAVFGCGYANLYSIVIARAFKLFPDRIAEVSSLMITSLAGGAIFTPLAALL